MGKPNNRARSAAAGFAFAAQLRSASPEVLDAHRRAAAVEARVVREQFLPPPKMDALEWADAFLYLPTEGGGVPGKYSSAFAPYQREPLQVMSDPTVSQGVLMWAAQTGKSLILQALIGHGIHIRPRPMLMVQPNIEFAEAWSKERFMPMLRETPELGQKVREAKSRSSDNTIRLKLFPGGFLALVGANAPAGVAGRAIALACCDEIDRGDWIAGTEGDTISLAKRRLATYAHGQLFRTSTPGNEGQSRIEPAFEAGDQRHYYVPCPHCGHMQTLKWGGKDQPFGLKIVTRKPLTVAYLCEGEACGALIEERWKSWMLAHGTWRAHNPDGAYPSWFLNGLYSPFPGSTWLHHMHDFLSIRKGDHEKLKTFVNTVLAEVWKEPGEVLDHHALLERLEDFPGTEEEPIIPAGVLVLTMGVDVQGNRIEVRVWGWGRGMTSWLIRRDVIPGDPETAAPWRALDEIRKTVYPHESGKRMRVARVFVDSGFNTSAVYAYCRARHREGVFACKGVNTPGAPIVGKPTHHGDAKVIIYPVGVYNAKVSLLTSRLSMERSAEDEETNSWPPGYVHLPTWVDVDELEQLTSEKLVTRLVKNRPVKEWILQSGRRNEALDCQNYAHAALWSFGIKALIKLGIVTGRKAPLGESAHVERVVAAVAGLAQNPAASGSGTPAATVAAPRQRRRIVSRGVQ